MFARHVRFDLASRLVNISLLYYNAFERTALDSMSGWGQDGVYYGQGGFRQVGN